MRREGACASESVHRERMKLNLLQIASPDLEQITMPKLTAAAPCGGADC